MYQRYKNILICHFLKYTFYENFQNILLNIFNLNTGFDTQIEVIYAF